MSYLIKSVVCALCLFSCARVFSSDDDVIARITLRNQKWELEVEDFERVVRDLQSKQGAVVPRQESVTPEVVEARCKEMLQERGGKLLLPGAIYRGLNESVEKLLTLGVDPREVPEVEQAFYMACCMSYYVIIERLLQAGVKPDVKDVQTGYTPLMIADCHVSKFLMSYSASVDVKHYISGKTALMYAVDTSDTSDDTSDTSKVALLLNAGASRTLTDCEGNTAEDTARMCGDHQLADYIRDFVVNK